MQIGIIGLGRMGGNIARRLLRNGHDCVVYDARPWTRRIDRLVAPRRRRDDD